MKPYLTLVLAVLCLVSCDTDDNPNDAQLVVGKWNLTKITNTSIGGSTTPDADNTHYYDINSDGTFKKILIENGASEELEGTYAVSNENIYYGNEDNSIQKFIALSYATEVVFLNCGILDDHKELLILNSDSKIQNNLGGACDGEDYEYTKEN